MECKATALFSREKLFLLLRLMCVIYNIYDSVVFALVMVYVIVTLRCKTILYSN
jgi:hypothetical protein